MGIKFDKDPSAVEQNNYLTKIENFYIVYDLDAWQKNPANNFKFKNYLFGPTNIVKLLRKKIMYVVVMELYLIMQIHGVLIMTLPEML